MDILLIFYSSLYFYLILVGSKQKSTKKKFAFIYLYEFRFLRVEGAIDPTQQYVAMNRL